MTKSSFVRTCQECGYRLHCKEPSAEHKASAAYGLRKCPECKSEAFDYGSMRAIDDQGNDKS